MRNGLFGTAQEGVDELVYQLPQVVLTCSCSLQNTSMRSLADREKTHLDATTASADKEVVQQDNDSHNEKEMN
jgi:hypothetical protein